MREEKDEKGNTTRKLKNPHVQRKENLTTYFFYTILYQKNKEVFLKFPKLIDFDIITRHLRIFYKILKDG